MKRLLDWLKGSLRVWLAVPTEAQVAEIAQKQYRIWERVLQEKAHVAARREDELNRIAGQVTLAVSDVMTAIELAKRDWQAFVDSQKEQEDGRSKEE